MGETKHDGLAIPGRVVLAHEPPFTIGTLRVEPAARQVVAESESETLEPRVMQVLVALAHAEERIVTRDELLERCWDGRIVTDDAINRVLSRIRQIGSGIGGGSFTVQTVTKVGYRLVAQSAGDRPETPTFEIAPPPAQPVGRRRALIAGVAAVAAAGLAGGLILERPWRHRVLPEARDLFRRGDLAQRAGMPDQSRQSVTYFERAVRIDPQYADAWGALALAYTHNLDGFAEAELASLPGRIRSAAAQALRLDPDNADAQLALICVKPFFRNWAGMETELRRLCQRYPEHWLAHGRLGMLMYQVGRLEEGAALHRRVTEIDPMIPVPYGFAAAALSSAGRIQEAETLLDEAHERWPAHPLLWIIRYNHLLFSGRPQAATALVMDPDALPSGFGAAQVEPRLMLARAVSSREPADIEASVEHQREIALADTGYIPIAATIFSLLGRLDLTFASLERYLFNRGAFGSPSPIGPFTRRYTDTLFTPAMAAARADPRFDALVREVGLQSYWEGTRSVPAYRRA